MLKCECCGGNKNLQLGCYTLFSEFNVICESCIGELMAQETAPTPLEVAKNRLDELNLADEDVYAFFAEHLRYVVKALFPCFFSQV